jgi:hypothetical protein
VWTLRTAHTGKAARQRGDKKEPGQVVQRPLQAAGEARPKKRSSVSPTARTLKYLRALGFTCEVTERWVPWPAPGHRKDLFGFCDVLAVREAQTCSTDDVGGFPIAAGWTIEVWAWKKPTKTRRRWALRRLALSGQLAALPGCQAEDT